MANNSTQLVSSFQTGTGWTIDVTAANLSPNLAEKDFDAYVNSGISLLSNWNKLSQTQLQYVGASLPAATPITIVRRTAIVRIQELVYGSRLNTVNYEGELNKIHQILSDLKVQPPPVLSPSLIDYTSYTPSVWALNPVQAPTARAVKTAIDFAIANPTLPPSASFSGTLGVTGLTTLGALTVSGVPTFTQQIQGSAGINLTGGSVVVGAGNVSVTGNIAATGTLGISGNTTLSGTLGVVGATTLSNATNTLTNAPATLTAVGTEMVNAGWVRRSIRPYIRVLDLSGSQSIPNAVDTTVTLATENSDVDNCWSTNIFTVPAGCSGIYMINQHITFTTGCSFIALRVLLNGTLLRLSSTPNTTGVDPTSNHSYLGIFPLAAGDNIRMQVFQLNTSSAARTISSAEMTIVRLGNL
jgi:hypothetical protein